MTAARRVWCLLALLSAAAVAAAPAEPDELEGNRRLLERWRADPDHAARLARDLRAFYALPAEKQRRLRELDRHLHEGDEAARAKRWAVVGRYLAWLEALPQGQRRQVDQAPDAKARLAAVRAIREQQWVASLPKRLRDELAGLAPAERARRVAELREQERGQRREWQGLGPEGAVLRPAYLNHFPDSVQKFVERELGPRLNEVERREMALAEGKWPELPNLIHRLSEKYPVLPPLPSGPITQMKQLPTEPPPPMRKVISGGWKLKDKGKMPKELRAGRWPDFALAASEAYRKLTKGKAPPPLGASRPGELPAATQEYVQLELMPRADERQREELRRLEGRWPEYPLKLHAVARSRGLVIPGMSLPGPRQLWARAQSAALPEVPGHVLWRFAQEELTPRDRAELGVRPDDPLGNRDRFRKEFLRREKQQKDRRPAVKTE